MIERFTDHAANERTYLAWIRTALAFMGFGLLLERFELLVRVLPAGAAVGPPDGTMSLASIAGLVLIALGISILAISSQRYLKFRRLIASDELRDFRSSRTDFALVFLVAALAALMAVYLVMQPFE